LALQRTPDGRPDLQGFWTNATFTPFERPQSLAGREFFTAEEAAAYEQKRLQEEEGQSQDDLLCLANIPTGVKHPAEVHTAAERRWFVCRQR
jgi:hypothetical protein